MNATPMQRLPGRPAPVVPVESIDPPSALPGQTRRNLLVLAAALFRKNGYAATTTRELASELGIKKASLYHHINSKEDLLYQISLESLDNISTTVAAAGAAADESGRLGVMIRAHAKAALLDRDMHMTMLTELRALTSARRSVVLEKRDAYEAVLRTQIKADQDAGRLRSDIDARYVTLSLLNLLNWTIFWFDPDGEMTAEQIGEMLETIFFDGARPADGNPATR